MRLRALVTTFQLSLQIRQLRHRRAVVESLISCHLPKASPTHQQSEKETENEQLFVATPEDEKQKIHVLYPSSHWLASTTYSRIDTPTRIWSITTRRPEDIPSAPPAHPDRPRDTDWLVTPSAALAGRAAQLSTTLMAIRRELACRLFQSSTLVCPGLIDEAGLCKICMIPMCSRP